MKNNHSPGWRYVILAAALTATLAGCTNNHRETALPTETGVPQMTSADPAPPPGWKVTEVIPQSQQQAQDTAVGYLKRTLAAFPPGTVIDANRYGAAGHNSYCDDNDSSPSAPMYFHTIGELKTPAGVEAARAVEQAGEAWSSWGWYVVERDGFNKPNRFGYGPDGYRIQIESSAQPGYPPTVQAISPCFPGTIASDDIPTPALLRGE